MKTPILVSPSILSADFANLQREIEAVVQAGAEWIHVDVMDGHFVPNLTIGAPVVASIRPITKAVLDVHLMIENPEKYLEDFARAGSDMITFHVEATKDPAACIRKIRDLGKRPGITLRPPTSVDQILPFVKDVDMVLIMTVNPGFSGQSFMSDQMSKIRAVRDEATRLGKKDFLIQVDGGVNDKTVSICIENGANVLVAGNYVFKNNYAQAIAALKAPGRK